jgi:predicted outer membrane lipoprotein
MKITNTLILATILGVIVLCMFGCTTQAWYEGAKQGAENECRSQPPSEIDRCLERLNKKTYEDYEKERAGAK